jgi:hypothetical protein
MKYIITEEQNIILATMRRLDEIWEHLKDTYPFQYPCDYHSIGHFSFALRYEVFEGLDLNWFNKEKDDEEVVWDTIVQLLGNKIKERYDDAGCDENAGK